MSLEAAGDLPKGDTSGESVADKSLLGAQQAQEGEEASAKAEGVEEVKVEGESGEKPGEGKEGESGEGEKRDLGVPDSPEGYELKLPEGLEVDQEALAGYKALAHELKLPAEVAQRLLSFEAQRIQDQLRQAQAKTEAWIAELHSDRDFGGPRFNENVDLARRGLRALAGDQLESVVKALNETGAGNHPALVRLFARAGKMASETPFLEGKDGGPTGRSFAETMYPNQGK